jgi:hypothetical protein
MKILVINCEVMSTSQTLTSFYLTVVKNLGDEPHKISLYLKGFNRFSGQKVTYPKDSCRRLHRLKAALRKLLTLDSQLDID